MVILDIYIFIVVTLVTAQSVNLPHTNKMEKTPVHRYVRSTVLLCTIMQDVSVFVFIYALKVQD